jgi:Protein of unknown function (DUF3048) N-terminal domain/Protein of unknown function (DUF3048) C-terminal domain
MFRAPNARRALPAIALLSVGALVAAACGGGDDAAPTTPAPTTASPTTTTLPTTTTSTTSTTTTTLAPTTTTLPEIIRMPLTGAPIESADEIPQRPALAVKIDNAPPARPQAGLGVADIVFEEIVEGSITRFAAVFHSTGSDPVGPIRSGRTQDLVMLAPLGQPAFAWSGGNPTVTRVIAESDFIDLNAGRTPGYYRRSGRGGAPHNLYSSTDDLWDNVPPELNVAPTPIFTYLRPEEAFTGDPAETFEVVLDGIRNRWTWDAEAGVYRREMNGRVHEDELTGPITADNVVVMQVDYQPSFADRRSPEAQLLGTGTVYLFADGQVRQGRWIHILPNDPYGFVDDADELIGIPPGRTWVQLPRAEEGTVILDPE